MMLDNRRLSKCKEVNLNNLKNWMLNRYVVSTMLFIFSPSCFADFITNTLLYMEKNPITCFNGIRKLLDNITFYNELCSKSLFSVAF